MTYYTMIADFDRDGRITGSTKELAGSKTYPGGILIPNLDVDPQSLPGKGTLRPRVASDFESDRRVRNENDITKVVIRKNAGAGGVPHTVSLRVMGAKARRLRVFMLGRDQRKVPLQDVSGGFVEYNLPEISSELTIYLEIDSFSGGLDIPEGKARLDDAQLELQLHRLEAGIVYADDFALFTIAPLIFLDNGHSAKRVYMCDMRSTDDRRGNEPSVHDFKEGMQKYNRGVPVIMIPRSANGGDAWIQDQYQIGYVYDGSRVTKRMVLHIPRLRANVVMVDDRPNLAAFVNSHFPSQNVGVCNDLWKQPAGTYTDSSTSNARAIRFSDSFESYLLYKNLATAWGALVRFDFYIRPWEQGTTSLAPLRVEGKERRDQADFLRGLPPSLVATHIDTYTQRAIEEAERLDSTVYSNEFRIRLERLDDQMERRLTQGNDLERVIFRLKNGAIEFTPLQFDDSFNQMEDIHESKNYGGNVEVIPASTRAPLGMLLLGSKESMNRPLVNFLEQQAVQPLVDIDTSWLGVGHVDEIVTFMSAPDEDSGSICFHADTRLAHSILEIAFARYLQGVGKVLDEPFKNKVRERKRDLDREEYNRVSGGHMNIWDIQGDHIVTRLFRGKRWLHSRPPGAVTALEPPLFYQELPQTDYQSVEGDDKHYNATINLQVFLNAVASTNLAIQEQFLDPNLEVLKEEVDGATYVPLPALFDTVPNGEDGYDWKSAPTGAIVPGAANMQVVGKTLFIPRQYTARMRADDVIWVLKSVMPAEYHARLNKEIFKRVRLNEYPVWMHGPFYTHNTNDLLFMAVEFQDGFWEHGTRVFDSLNAHNSEKASKVQKLILARNKAAFSKSDRPMLKDGWNKVYIPENTVDLFEAYIQTAANHHGFNVHWVDTWYYHLRLGQIHCGTNVVRNPNPKRTQPWWKHRVHDR